MAPAKRGRGRPPKKRSLEESSYQESDKNTPMIETKRISESDMFASICLPTAYMTKNKVYMSKTRPPSKKPRLISPGIGESTTPSASDQQDHDIHDDPSVTFDDTILDFDDSITTSGSVRTTMATTTKEKTSSDVKDTNNEELEEPTQPISVPAVHRGKKAAATPTSIEVEPPVSTMAARRTKQAAKAASTTTSTTSPEPLVSAIAARRAKEAAEAAEAAATPTSIEVEPPVSTMAARRTKQAAKAASTTTSTTSPEPLVSAMAARRAKEAAEAATSDLIESPLISAVAARQQPETHSSTSTGNQQVTITTTGRSERVPGKIFGSPPPPSPSSSTISYMDDIPTDDNEGTEKFITPKERFTDELFTPNEAFEADETVLEDEGQERVVSWKNEEKKKKAQWKESNKLMDPYSISTYSSDNAIPFEHEGDTYYCIGFEKGQKLVFIGYSLIGVLYGSIDIGGATISSNHNIPTSLNSAIEPSRTVSFFPVFSPRTSALTVVRSTPYAKTATVSPSSTLTSSYSDLNPLLESFLPRLDTLESIIIVKNMEWCGVDQLERINPSLKNLFCLDTRKDFVLNDGPVYEDIVGFQPIVRVTPEVRAMKIESSWSTSVDDVLEYEEDSSAASVSMVCGTKNVGKSSFARYMINRLLKSHQRVAYLETDVGQTEFTPSGLVSLHIVESPLLGPPFTHLNLKVKRSFFIGSTSPNKDSAYYQDCIHQLLETYRKEINTSRSSDNDISQPELVPLVVNTCGWTKGLGYDLLLGIATDVAPTHVFAFSPSGGFGASLPYNFEEQIVEAAQKSSLPEFRPVVVRPMQAPAMTMSENQQQSIPTSSPYPRQRRFIAPSTMADKYQAADHRNLMLLSYMYHDAKVFGTRQDGRSWWNVNPRLVDRVPWTIDWRQHLHGVWVLFEDVPPSTLLYALNGSLVGLIGKANNNDDKVATADAVDMIEGESMEMEEEINAQSASTKMDEAQSASTKVDDSQPRSETAIPIKYYSPMTSAPPNPVTTNCYGLGIIRGVDMEKQRLHLLTPLSLEQLRHVDSLVKGELDIPVHLMLDQYVGSRHQNCGVTWRQVPYLSHDVIDSIGSSAPKLRRNLMRRSQNIG